eukprot:1309655-Rhodomonas_salina.2
MLLPGPREAGAARLSSDFGQMTKDFRDNAAISALRAGISQGKSAAISAVRAGGFRDEKERPLAAETARPARTANLNPCVPACALPVTRMVTVT